MEKTKLGISVSLFAAVAALLGLYGGYVIVGILLGYVLLKEENAWLKNFCVKVGFLMLAFSVASTAINLVPNMFGLLYDFLGIFGVNFYLSFVGSFFGFLSSILSALKPVVFILLALCGLMNKEIKIPVVDKFLSKHLG